MTQISCGAKKALFSGEKLTVNFYDGVFDPVFHSLRSPSWRTATIGRTSRNHMERC